MKPRRSVVPLPLLDRIRAVVLLALCLLAAPSFAHVVGLVDTSIQIAEPGVRVVYTLPAASLPDAMGTPDASLRPPETYEEHVSRGWRIEARGGPCAVTELSSSELPELEAYQYRIDYACDGPLEELSVVYDVFHGAADRHDNFTRVFLAQRRMRHTFDESAQRLDVPVGELLRAWGDRLDASFPDSDPNRDLAGPQREGAEREGTPRVGDPRFLRLGVVHILTGPDHVAFVVALIVVPATLRRIALWVSSFTIAHTVTLALAFYGVIDLAPSITEPLVALTVLAVGIENLLIVRGRERVLRLRTPTIFAFGLVHGVGLSYQLGAALSLSGQETVERLLLFNVGVELGQLLIVACLYLPLRAVFRRPFGPAVSYGASAVICAGGLFWLTERLLALPA